MRHLLGRFDVECLDALQFPTTLTMDQLKGWPLKPFSVIHSPFREVLSIDADNYPVQDPTYLFELPAYKEHGAIFWPDVRLTPENAHIWKMMGLQPRLEPEFESGQMLIDKAKCMEPLRLAMQMNEQPEVYYKLLWGDKDTYRFAWHKYGQPFAMTPRPVEMLSIRGGPCCAGVMCQHDLEGERIFQHRNLFKWQFHGENPMVPGFLFEGECRELLEDLRAQWDGRIDNAPLPDVQSKAAQELIGRTWMINGLGARNAMVVTTTESPVAFDGADSESTLEVDEADDEGSERWPKPDELDLTECSFHKAGRVERLNDARFTKWALRKVAGELCLEMSDEKRVQARLTRAPGPRMFWHGRLIDQAGKLGKKLVVQAIEDRFPALRATNMETRKRGDGALHVFTSARGIGDQIVALYAATGIAALGYEVSFYTRCPEWLERVDHSGVRVMGEQPPNGEGRKVIDLNLHYPTQLRHGTDKAAWYASALSKDGPIKAARPDLSLENVEPCFPFDRYVLLMPFAAWPERDWPEAHWNRLAHLIDKANYHVVVVGLEKDETRLHKTFNESRAMWVIDQESEWVIHAMLGAQAVIGPDSGMVHVAGLHGVPTICVHAQLPSEFLFSCAPSARSVLPQTACVACRWQPENGYTSACESGCSALATVGPEAVMEAFYEIAPPVNREKGELWSDSFAPRDGSLSKRLPERPMPDLHQRETERKQANEDAILRVRKMPHDKVRKVMSEIGFPTWLHRAWPPKEGLDIALMEKLFPLYEGPTTSIQVTKAYMLSVDRPENRARVDSALGCLTSYALPPVEVVWGFEKSNIPTEMLERYFGQDKPPKEVRLTELTVTAMKVWEEIAAGDDEWVYVFEDDVRVGNVPAGSDLTTWCDVPEAAEMLTFNRHSASTPYDPSKAAYAQSYSGGSSHAVLLSKAAAKKLLAYAEKWHWRREIDIDLYTVCRGYSPWLRTGYSNWQAQPDFVDVELAESDKIAYFDLATSSVFAQVSSPCPPISDMAIPPIERSLLRR